MAEALFNDYLAREHPESVSAIEVSSAGIGGWHTGQHADDRTLIELKKAGIDGSYLRASQVNEYDLTADVLVAMDSTHAKDLELLGASENQIHLMREFDPQAPAGAQVEDPYYGGVSGFAITRAQIEAALPGLYEYLTEGLH